MKRMSRHCPNCGSETAEDAKFCVQCGTPVPPAAAPESASADGQPPTLVRMTHLQRDK